MAWSGGEKRRRGWLSGASRKGNELTARACESAIGERRGMLEKCATPRRKHYPVIMTRRFGPTRLAKEAASCGGRAGRRGQSRPDPRGNSNGNLIFEFQEFLEFGKTLRNSKRRFRRNMGMGIFPKFF
jgi:hypothetical protein